MINNQEVVSEVLETVVVDMYKTIIMETYHGNIKVIEATKRFMSLKISIFS